MKINLHHVFGEPGRKAAGYRMPYIRRVSQDQLQDFVIDYSRLKGLDLISKLLEGRDDDIRVRAGAQ